MVRERERERIPPPHPAHPPPQMIGQGPKQKSFITFGFNQIANSSSASSSPSRPSINVNVEGVNPGSQNSDTPEIRKYKKRYVHTYPHAMSKLQHKLITTSNLFCRFNSEILCAALWGVNLLIGTENGLMLLDRSGQVSKVHAFHAYICAPSINVQAVCKPTFLKFP